MVTWFTLYQRLISCFPHSGIRKRGGNHLSSSFIRESVDSLCRDGRLYVGMVLTRNIASEQ